MKQVSMLAAAGLLAGAAVLPMQKGLTQMNIEQTTATQVSKSHPYVGMWVTADGHIRHNLLPNGRYDEARGNRDSAYQGAMRSGATTSTTGTTPALPPMANLLTACSTTQV